MFCCFLSQSCEAFREIRVAVRDEIFRGARGILNTVFDMNRLRLCVHIVGPLLDLFAAENFCWLCIIYTNDVVISYFVYCIFLIDFISRCN